MRVVPVPSQADRADAGQIRTFHAPGTSRPQRPAPPVDAMAGQTVVTLHQVLSQLQGRLIRHAHVRVACSAAGIRIPGIDHRPRPEMHVAVRIRLVSRSALTSVAYGTAKFTRIVNHGRVRRQHPTACNTRLAGRHPDMARHAAVGHVQLRNHNLAQADIDRPAVGVRRYLDPPPVLQQILLHRGDDQQCQHAQTRPQ